MKIVMTLAVEEAGRLHYIKRPGELLEAGCVIACLQLDDPSKVKPVSLLGAAIPSYQLPVGILGMIPRGQNGGAALMRHHSEWSCHVFGLSLGSSAAPHGLLCFLVVQGLTCTKNVHLQP